MVEPEHLHRIFGQDCMEETTLEEERECEGIYDVCVVKS